jgi:hypothetical protein
VAVLFPPAVARSGDQRVEARLDGDLRFEGVDRSLALRGLLNEALDEGIVNELVQWTHREDTTQVARQEREALARKVRNLELAVEDAEEPEDVRRFMAKRREVMHELKRLDSELADAPPPLPENELRDAMLRRVEEWRKVLLARHIEECRTVLQRMVGYFEVIDESTLPDYVKNLPRTLPDGVPPVNPKFAAFLNPEAFGVDTYFMASPQGFEPWFQP